MRLNGPSSIFSPTGGGRSPPPPAGPARRGPRAPLFWGQIFGFAPGGKFGGETAARRSRSLAPPAGLGGRAAILRPPRGFPRGPLLPGLPRRPPDSASGCRPRARPANAGGPRSARAPPPSRLRPHIVARAALAGRERLIRLDRSRERAVAAMIER